MTVRVLVGDSRSVLKTLDDSSVHCVVTSPPYYGLRDYGVAGQIGLEASPDEFIAEMVGVFREIWRVLRDDGTVWLNLGDSYASGGGTGTQGSRGARFDRRHTQETLSKTRFWRDRGIKPKDLMMMPHRVAIALQSDGWWVRQDNVWFKLCPMPESVDDRHTRAHEYVFQLTKSENYFYDPLPIEEPVTGGAHDRGSGVHRKSRATSSGVKQNASFSAAVTGLVATRNARSVWPMTSEPFPEAHFATMPTKLARTCILAGTSEAGCCASCGAPLVRLVERGEPDRDAQRACGSDLLGRYAGQARKDYAAAGVQNPSAVKARILDGMRPKITVGWEPSCRCPVAPPVPCTVLDPFGGSGTTGLVADRLRRDAILIDLNPDYAAMARRRIEGESPLFSPLELV